MEKVVLLKTPSYERNLMRTQVERIFNEFGGAEKFFKSGENVVIKPNLLFGRPADAHVTTHPELVFAVGSILKDIGCRITIGDSPGIGSAVSVAKKCGIEAVANELGAKVVNFEQSVEVKPESGDRIFKKFEIAREVYEADKVVNLPKLKSHAQMLLTMAVKNTFGTVVGIRKPEWHFKAGLDAEFFARMIVELNLLVAPDFTIMDGIFGMEGNGPANGTVRELNILIGGVNCVAIDTVASALLKFTPDQFFTGRAAKKMNYPGSNIKDIEVAGDRIDAFDIKDFKLPRNIMASDWRMFGFLKKILKGVFNSSPNYHKNLCKMCKICVDICPAKAISVSENKDGGLNFDLKKCIRCFCCQEMCPHAAITVKKSLAENIRNFFGK